MKLQVFTTRPDTIFGVSFMVLAPESDYVKQLTTPAQQQAVNEYLDYVAKRTERERQSEVKKVTGVFTGSYAVNPFTQQAIPVWISEYVLAGYGTGAIMAVPAHDSRDYAFARKFNLPIVPVIDNGQPIDLSESSYDAKEGKMINSGVINGMEVKEAIKYIAEDVEKRGIGKSKINYRLRDAIFSRQRYWGEPFPVYYKDDMPYMLDESKLPLELPEIDKYLPTETENRHWDGPKLANRRRLSAGIKYHARICRFFSLLLTLHGSAQRQGIGKQRSQRILEKCRFISGRSRTCHRPPDLFPFLESLSV